MNGGRLLLESWDKSQDLISRLLLFFSKNLDNTIKGWTPCLRALAATALLVQEANKVTYGQPTQVSTPHQVLVLNKSPLLPNL